HASLRDAYGDCRPSLGPDLAARVVHDETLIRRVAPYDSIYQVRSAIATKIDAPHTHGGVAFSGCVRNLFAGVGRLPMRRQCLARRRPVVCAAAGLVRSSAVPFGPLRP